MYIGALLLGVVIHVLSPIAIFPATHVQEILGGFLLALSGAFARWAFLTMRRLGTVANPKKPSKALATHGPFRISRNPIYVAMTGLYIGLAFLVNSAWLLMLLVPLLMFMQWGVILREERYLTGKFGNEYTAYSSRVRRWL
jgi:protein-S-isoprenylcysteine O-methyltransferase Ste14